MRRRLIITLGAVLLAGTVLAARPPQETHALQAWLQKAKSDCESLQAAITLVYTHDDTGDAEYRDFFKLEIYDEAGNFLAHIDESILQEQSPFYWQTGRIPANPFNGKYKLVMLDTDDKGNMIRRIERVWHDCTTGYSWRTEKPLPDDPDIPEVTCWAWVPIFTTNLAPEDGAVVALWSYLKERDKDDPEYREFHLSTIDVAPNEGLDEYWLRAPCGTYLKLYFQPDSTKLIYYMPSQYWPHDSYGVPDDENDVGPVYYTFFPLDGPIRPEILAQTPQPTATPTQTPTPTPTATPES